MTETKAAPGTMALSAEYQLARVLTAEARTAAREAEGRTDWMRTRNTDHATEVERASGHRYLTNQQVKTRGSGSGFQVIYRTRCTADGHNCHHDPLEQPFSDNEIAAAETTFAAAGARSQNLELT